MSCFKIRTNLKKNLKKNQKNLFTIHLGTFNNRELKECFSFEWMVI